MERPVERRPGRVLARRQPRLDLLERERVVAEPGRCRLEVRERGRARLVVALDRRALAEAGDAVVAQLDLDDVVLVARLARDHERLGEAQGDDPGGELHRRNPNRTELQNCFAPPNLAHRITTKGENDEAIDRARDRAAGGARRHGRAGDRRSGVRSELGVCSGWEAAGAAAFDSLGALTATGSSARTAGNVTKEPSLSATYEALPDSAKGKARAGFRAGVPVWIHVISDGATGNVPQSVIDEQMSVLNLAFAGFYGGAGSGFSFTLAGVTRTDNAAWYNARSNSNPEREMKKTLHRGGFDTLNVYTNLAGGFLGYAYLPGLPGLAPLAGRDRAQLGVDAGRVADVRRAATTSASRSCTRPATGSTSSTRSSAAATPRATSSTTRRRCGSRRAAAPRARTRASSPGSTRSTTTWTTRTTPVTTSSRRVRSAGCRTAGSSTGHRRSHRGDGFGRPRYTRFSPRP